MVIVAAVLADVEQDVRCGNLLRNLEFFPVGRIELTRPGFVLLRLGVEFPGGLLLDVDDPKLGQNAVHLEPVAHSEGRVVCDFPVARLRR